MDDRSNHSEPSHRAQTAKAGISPKQPTPMWHKLPREGVNTASIAEPMENIPQIIVTSRRTNAENAGSMEADIATIAVNGRSA